ncbi:V-type ATP synthase subunit B [Halomonas elongata]|uniref:V-type ATP synthase subunit B n=1 Tax=Halomonas elongata (strain ATCC 33173 / DSM 2581 / NBRC 15536 / NCIMB 2198 / 1H9) TaxID=768066 RepID=E1V378_HALED|nr:V-type ATP synthase subunit B [Halomonas elongata]MBW5800623.1 V-type ATP synthase subunit B [Halomonas elongata]RAW07836.1 V-type ATP synthase subunit B [Halomonas elongata]WBF19852.1 V-type ATP synthase subunit B [Halomonas elongata]WPU48722.1 V-type ATP synthase subunit B [Halomonas elongata DSM 2581]CBV42557.1 V-type ATP synthase subunit B [Halomonas elongata DSM 2581]
MTRASTSFRGILSIVGDIVEVDASIARRLGIVPRNQELAMVEQDGRPFSLAQVARIDRERVSLKVFTGTQGLSNRAQVRFLGEMMQAIYSTNIFGRVFNGSGQAMDFGPALEEDPRVEISGPTVNPMARILASRMIRTDIPMIDVFNCLVESQKIPIFSVAGEPHNALLSRIAVQADADVVVFGGIGLIYDDFHTFRKAFEDAGILSRSVMFANLASDPVVERTMIPDLALAVAERLAVEEGKRVLVLLSDMTAFADALKELGIAMEHIPSNRGYMGDLYSQLARRYEKACDFKGAGSVTILAVTTMPGGDVTHPVPDNTGYITEGQFYLHDGVLDPFGSLSRLKQHVIGKQTREDHGQIMNTMIRYYAEGIEAEQKQAMAFELSPFDHKLLRFARRFRERFMDLNVRMPLEAALDACWALLAECFSRDEIVIKQSMKETYWPDHVDTNADAEQELAKPS